LRQKLKIKDESASGAAAQQSFVDKYLAGRFESVLQCDDPAAKEAGEEPVKSEEVFLKLDCHIDGTTSHLRDGILAGLEEKIEKKSPALDADVMYTKQSRIAR